MIVDPSDDSAGEYFASIARGLAILGATATQIVGILTNDDGSTDDRIGSGELDDVIAQIDVSLLIRFVFAERDNIAQISHVSDAILGTAVLLLGRVEVVARIAAPVAQIAALMYVEAVIAGCEARQRTCYLNTKNLKFIPVLSITIFEVLFAEITQSIYSIHEEMKK